MTALFTSHNDKLFIDGKEVIKGFESFSGWYWFATKVDRKQDSIMANGKIVKDDTIYYGFVQGFEEEWGPFSLAELTPLIEKGKVWEIPKANLPHSGRRGSGQE